MYDYTTRVDAIWKFTRFIANYVGHKSSVTTINGTIDEDILTIRALIRELFAYFMVSREDEIEFRYILEFDDSVGTYNSHLGCLSNCVDRLGIYSNMSHALRQSFFTEDGPLLSHEDLELLDKYCVE